MLHQETGAGDAHPAAGTHEDGLSTGLHQLDDVRVEADGRHGQDNEELGELLEGLEEAGIHTRHGGNCGDDGGQDKEEDEEGEDLLDVKEPLEAPPPRLACQVRQKASTSVMGIMARVRVSLTMVAYSSTAPLVPWRVSQVEAAA